MGSSTRRVADYDDPRFNYKKYWQKRQYGHEAEKLVLKRFFKQIPKKNSLVDIGGGFGRLTPFYAPLFRKTVLIDRSQRLLKKAKKLEKEFPHFEAKKGLATNLPLKNNSFDVALMIRTIHHLSSIVKAFKEVRRVLKPGGFFILEFANKTHFKAILKAYLTLNLYSLTSHTPIEKSNEVIFLNLHPQVIRSLLFKNGFEVIKAVSVSNFRNTFLRKILPLKILIFLENIAQRILPAYISGPSVFILAQKN